MVKIQGKKNTKAQIIKALLIIKGISGAEIARRAGVTRAAVYHVIEGRSKSPRLRKLIADVLGLSVEEIWPESYTGKGKIR